MADKLGRGKWLLIDAAGPESVIGIIENGEWVACRKSEQEFLEWMQPATEEILASAGCVLEDLRGVIYGNGPGSTLGLRLAAMFIRSLMKIPGLKHWKCFSYHNLELVLAGGAGVGSIELVAPWRRDKLHHAYLASANSGDFKTGSISTEDALQRKLTGIKLGRRITGPAQSISWQPYPIDAIPGVLWSHQDLLNLQPSPTPYSAEKPAFAEWNPERHRGT